MKGLSEKTLNIVQKMFSAEHQKQVVQLLETACGNNLIGFERSDEIELERVRFAVLKLSKGDPLRFVQALEFAQGDWRDLLVEAGFASDTTRHIKWADNYLSKK